MDTTDDRILTVAEIARRTEALRVECLLDETDVPPTGGEATCQYLLGLACLEMAHHHFQLAAWRIKECAR